MWVPPEDSDPVTLHEPTIKSLSVFGAVRSTDGKLITMLSNTFNADTFQLFLKRLIRHGRKKRKIVLIVDNARYHHARILRPWLKKYRKKIRIDFLPPYSPNLNPIERVWKLARRLCTHNRHFPKLENLEKAVLNQFQNWTKPNETLRKLCAII